MACKNCKWFKVYDFIFPDSTKTIACEKYKKHLGFTNKNGQVKNIRPINECRFNCSSLNKDVVNAAKDEDDSKGRVLMIKGKWAVEVYEAGITSVIFTSKYKEEALQKLEMFKNKKSWITGISYTRRYKKWIAKIYIKKFKYKQVGTFKTFAEAKKALNEEKALIVLDEL
ncbi:hypothetical protein LPC13_05225 [Clostridium celatum]|uniref:AP2 domain-containing protein n=1 Tax=Clostridium celatum TaxID=36834 RepID=UPI001F37A43A|nr:AP2 domain-containing protein [Clostridium celatum]MCE9654677.1 hypothetical protein [Clostridium celatum]